MKYKGPDEAISSFEQPLERFRDSTPEIRNRIRIFLTLGRQNPWIRGASDPPFCENSIHICEDIDELTERILRGNWCLGQAFVLGEIAFINQIDGGDEWLTIKGSTPFESITMQIPSETKEQATTRLHETVENIQNATEEQCKALKYRPSPTPQLNHLKQTNLGSDS